MSTLSETEVRIPVGDAEVSGLLIAPASARACYVLAHGAGVGMRHSFMSAVASGLSERGIATLRYQFPYMERGSRRPDSPKAAQAAVRAAVGKARELLPDLELVAGGKSYGARMTSQAQAEAPLDGVRGLAFLGFPLHAPGQPSDSRAKHLARVEVPMLFLQGWHDDFADLAHLTPLVQRLGARARLKLFDDADHSFHVPAKSGRTDADVMTELLDGLAAWIETVTA
ncbi:MAG TPA: alpha/beta family hydrolase [Rhizomicrobium sp.]|nr:alpha/beta family hydrolase [Rhizomicrobium sp.]